MKYYKLYTSSPYCGTDNTELIVSSTEVEYNEDEIKEDLFASYGYLIHGWNEEDPTEEEYEDFISDCEVTFEELTEEQFQELLDEGYSATNWG